MSSFTEQAKDLACRTWVTSLALRMLGWDKEDLNYLVGLGGLLVVPGVCAPVAVCEDDFDKYKADEVKRQLLLLEQWAAAAPADELAATWKKYKGPELVETLRGPYLRPVA